MSPSSGVILPHLGERMELAGLAYTAIPAAHGASALTVMQLVEEGKIDLDMPVQHYLPWFRVADEEPPAHENPLYRHYAAA